MIPACSTNRAAVTKPQRKGKVGNQWVKDHLNEYAESFPQVSSLLEANINRCIYGQRGFEHHTFLEMWELYSQQSRGSSYRRPPAL
ncbi:hypothetical protein VZT92_002237 [Zoarces viviparus]|uniref:Uncharacterized protein n=1 Tax=Zoarces viviparus TaxID=48416 RepID=A0AAW1FYC7_ZOAVI